MGCGSQSAGPVHVGPRGTSRGTSAGRILLVAARAAIGNGRGRRTWLPRPLPAGQSAVAVASGAACGERRLDVLVVLVSLHRLLGPPLLGR